MRLMAQRALGKRSESETVETLLFQMTDFSNCSKINLVEKKAAGRDATHCLKGAGCTIVRDSLRDLIKSRTAFDAL